MNLNYVVLYMENTETSKDFWVEKIGFEVKKTVDAGVAKIYTVGQRGDNTNIELVPMALMANNPHGLNLGTPSLCFKTADIQAEYNRLTENGVKVTDIMDHGGMQVFTFFDAEEKAFAIAEVK